MPTALSALLTARPHRNKQLSVSVRKASTVLRLTHAQWPAHVSDVNAGKKLKRVYCISHNYSHIMEAYLTPCFIYSQIFAFGSCYRTVHSYNDWVTFCLISLQCIPVRIYIAGLLSIY